VTANGTESNMMTIDNLLLYCITD